MYDNSYLKPVTFTPRQRQIVLGSIFGDGHLEKRVGRAHSLLILACREADRQYIWWKYEELKGTGLFRPPFPVTSRSFDNYQYQSWRMESRKCRWFSELRGLFYPDGKKVVSPETLDLLDDLGVAVWYMDDGSLSFSGPKGQYPLIRLHTDSFGLEGNELIVKWFKERCGILFDLFPKKGSIKKDKRYWIVGLTGKDRVARFLSIVGPYIVPSMARKQRAKVLHSGSCSTGLD